MKQVVIGYNRHFFMQDPTDDYIKHNQIDEQSTLSVSNDKLVGKYLTCANAYGYLDWNVKRYGPLFVAEGPSYGFIKSRPHYGFTTKTYGIRLFGWEIHLGKSYNFKETKSGKRTFGLMVFVLKIGDKTIKVPSVKASLKLKSKVVIDPHLRKKK